jgi:hypothetical protein
MCFAWISEQTAIISLYSNKLTVFITEAECFLRGTNWVFKLHRYSSVLKGLIPESAKRCFSLPKRPVSVPHPASYSLLIGGSGFGIRTRLRTELTGVSNLSTAKDYSLHRNVQTCSWAKPHSC